MSRFAGEHRAVVDAYAALTADITGARSDADAKRLRSVIAAALRTQLRDYPSTDALPPELKHPQQPVPDTARAELLEDLESLADAENLPPEPFAIARRDEREMLLTGSIVDAVSGLSPSERLGPFTTHAGNEVFIDLFLTVQQLQVREAGSTAPAFVFTRARTPVITGTSTSVELEAGTVWIRGNLLDSSLPPGVYAGILISGGTWKLNAHGTVAGGVLQIPAGREALLELHPALDEPTPIPGACVTSDTKLKLPETLSFKFKPGVSSAKGSPGKARVWGQAFGFEHSTGNWIFIERLMTLVLEYVVTPRKFDADPVGDDLVHLEGIGDVAAAGLGLPVVVTSNPAILGPAARGADWLLLVQKLLARWYEPDTRLHELATAWLEISPFGATLVAENVAPLNPPVSHAYSLWTIAGGGDKRLPWRQSYEKPFLLFYRCHVVLGEQFLLQGHADVALDRPVTTDGLPVATTTTQGSVLIQKMSGTITAFLLALVADDKATRQFALRNALVWTGAPTLLFIAGPLVDGQQIDAGSALLSFGVQAWVPTLPDPYVSNAFIHRRNDRGAVTQLLGRIVWSAPADVTVSFEGQLGNNLALGGRDVSPGDSQPARKSEGDPRVGLTQTEQGHLTFDRKGEAAWKNGQAAEMHTRAQRVGVAAQENKQSTGGINGFMTEAAGPAPNVLLLDVSTNQDLLGVAVHGRVERDAAGTVGGGGVTGEFPVSDLTVHSRVAGMRVVALPQVQWEPVRTLDADQNIMTMGWFPTPLASATDGGATSIGARYQKLMPVIPEDAVRGTLDAFQDGVPVGVQTTFPFGLIGAIQLQPQDQGARKADLYGVTRPKFPDEESVGGIQLTAKAEGGRPDLGGVSPMFQGRMRQLLNGVDLSSGAPLGISVLGETLQPAGSVETVFNSDMTARPRVPVTRIDLSGYGGSNFSDWNNPFAAFAEAAKVQFKYMIGRTALEVIKVNSVLHPWGIRVTRSVTIERRPGGGVIRRDSGWQAFTPGIFDYRYADLGGNIIVAPYTFDAGVFRGLFNVRTIRPAPGNVFAHGTAKLVPYYFDADVALENVPGRTAAVGILGYLQTEPNGVPAGADALQALIEQQGPIGGPIDTWMNFGGSGLPFRAQRVEVGLTMNAGNPLFVATVRGVPKLPETGAWSVVVRPVASIPPNGGEAVPVSENRGVPVIRRYPVKFLAGDSTSYDAPRLDGVPGDYRFADAADLLTPAAPKNDYSLLQSTPTHAFLFPRPYVPGASPPRIQSGFKPALADLMARSTSKGSFPPAGNTIELGPGAVHFNVNPSGKLALNTPITIVGHPTPLRISGTTGHGSSLFYDTATMHLDLQNDRWEAEFTGMRVWSDISGLERITGSEMRVVGSTEQRPQIAEIKSLMLQEIEEILRYIPIFGQRGVQGPIDLGASNAKHEFKVEVQVTATIPPTQAVFPAGAGVKLKLFVKQSTGIDIKTGGAKASATFGAALEGKVPLLSIGVAAVFLIVSGEVTFSLTSVDGSVTAEKLALMAFVGVGVEGKIGPFKAYAFLGVGFLLEYDAIAAVTKYGGLVALEAGVDLVIVSVKIRAELKGLVYDDAGTTKCDYSGSVKVQVDIFLIFSISATYQVTETTSF